MMPRYYMWRGRDRDPPSPEQEAEIARIQAEIDVKLAEEKRKEDWNQTVALVAMLAGLITLIISGTMAELQKAPKLLTWSSPLVMGLVVLLGRLPFGKIFHFLSKSV